jgi:hypothetical protein
VVKIDFSQQLVGYDGRAMVEGEAPVTLALVCAASLMAIRQDDQTMPVKDKLRCHEIAGKVYKGGVVELSPEDVTFIRDRIGTVQPPIIVGPAFALLEG